MLGALTAAITPVALYAARAGGVVISTPGLNQKGAPNQVRVAIVIALGISLFAAMGPGTMVDADPLVLVALAPLELLIGVTLGFCVRLIFAAVEVAAEFASFQMGYAAAAAFDPTTGSTMAPPTRLMYVIAVLLFLSIDGHHQVILALAGSYDFVPVGMAGIESINAAAMLDLAYGLFETSARLAFPLIFVMFVINLVLGLLVRFVPQVNVFMIGFILTMGFGLLAMAELMPSMGMAITHLFEAVPGVLNSVIR
jgi:flagellar biosynthesis protein FliR